MHGEPLLLNPRVLPRVKREKRGGGGNQRRRILSSTMAFPPYGLPRLNPYILYYTTLHYTKTHRPKKKKKVPPPRTNRFKSRPNPHAHLPKQPGQTCRVRYGLFRQPASFSSHGMGSSYEDTAYTRIVLTAKSFSPQRIGSMLIIPT